MSEKKRKKRWVDTSPSPDGIESNDYIQQPKKLKEMREGVCIILFMGSFLILVGLISYGLSTDYNKDLIELSIICWVIGFWVYLSGLGVAILYMFKKKFGD